ncbi:THxN family PEP-CTERM protein [Parapedomonas caeni]
MFAGFMKGTALAAVTVAGLFGAQANAAMVNSWSYVLQSEFGDATFSSGTGSQVEDQLAVNWGSPFGSSDPRFNSNRSGIELEGDTVNGAGQAETSGNYNTNDLVNAGLGPSIFHINNSISGSYATLETAELFATLLLTPTSPAGSPLAPIAVTFDIEFSETVNQAPCADPVGPDCADIFVLGSGSLNQSFSYDGQTYYISIFEVTNSLTALDDDVCAAAGAPSGCIGFVTEEGKINEAKFGFVITTRPVLTPEPAAFALLGSGLVAGGLALRRRKK